MMRHSQKGLSLISLILFGIATFFIIIMFAKVLPAYLEYFAIKRVFSSMAADPQMADARPSAIRDSYSRRSQIDNITSVGPGDILINQHDGRLDLSASYHVEKPIMNNVGIYINFSPSSSTAAP